MKALFEINGIDGCSVPGTLCFLSDTTILTKKDCSLFHVRSIVLTGVEMGTAEARVICSGVGMESNLGSYKFLLYWSFRN